MIPPKIRAKLESSRVARLATLDPNLGPHLVPICFAYDGSVFYSAIDGKPKSVAPKQLARVKNIQATPQVALLLDEYDDDWSRLWYVLIRGKAETVSTPSERRRALKLLRAKYSQYTTDMLPDDGIILRIKPKRISAWGNL